MDIWLTKEGEGYRLHRHRYHGGTRFRLVDEKQELLQEIEDFEGTIYVPVRVDESAGDVDAYVSVPKEALKDLVERQQDVLWCINPLCGGKDALLKPIQITPSMHIG